MSKSEKRFFILLQKLCSFSRKSNFSILDFQISWRRQIPKHKTRKYVLLNNLGSKYSLLMKFDQLMSYSEKNNFIKKFYKNCVLKTSFRPFCVSKELRTNSTRKWNIWSNLLTYLIAKLSKVVQISMLASSDSYLQSILWKLKRVWTSVQVTFFMEFSNKKFCKVT